MSRLAAAARRGLPPDDAVRVASVVLAAITSLMIPIALGLSSRRLRVAHHLYDAAYTLALGLVVSLAAAAWVRWGPRRRWPALVPALAVVALLSILTVHGPLTEDFDGLAARIAVVGSPRLWREALVVAAALAVPVALLLGRLSGHPWFRLATAALAITLAVENHLILASDYEGLHAIAAFIAGALLAAALAAPASEPAAQPAPWTKPRLALLAVPSLAAVLLVVLPPSRRVWAEMARVSASPVVVPLAALRSLRSELAPAEASDPWFQDRAAAPDRPPSSPGLNSAPKVLLLFTIDAVRADVITDPRWAAMLPHLSRLRRESVFFTQARSPAPQTFPAIAGLFASKYYSQLYWSSKEGWGEGHVFPDEDPSPRFPERLRDAGFSTFTASGFHELCNEYGLVRGFVDERRVPRRHIARASELANAVIERLRSKRAAPQFIYAHFLEPHEPYDRAGTEGPLFERYVREIALVDAEIGRIRAELARLRLDRQAVIVVSADHGEAFGEHRTFYHATTLYEELVRVPLFVLAPGVAPREVGAPVSLVDVGPTLLDIAGLPTPGGFMGQSLLPLMRGEAQALERPLALESGRYMQGLILPDGRKVIRQRKRNTEEMYDLRADPDESTNLIDTPQGDEAMSLLSAFFRAHTLQRPGYVVPFRR